MKTRIILDDLTDTEPTSVRDSSPAWSVYGITVTGAVVDLLIMREIGTIDDINHLLVFLGLSTIPAIGSSYALDQSAPILVTNGKTQLRIATIISQCIAQITLACVLAHVLNTHDQSKIDYIASTVLFVSSVAMSSVEALIARSYWREDKVLRDKENRYR